MQQKRKVSHPTAWSLLSGAAGVRMRLKIDAITTSKTYIRDIQHPAETSELQSCASLSGTVFPNTSCCLTQMNSQWCNKLSSYKIKRFDTCLNRSQRAGARKYNRLHCTFLSQ